MLCTVFHRIIYKILYGNSYKTYVHINGYVCKVRVNGNLFFCTERFCFANRFDKRFKITIFKIIFYTSLIKSGEMKKLREDMQIIFQDPFASINPRMTVSQTIAEPLLIQGKYKPSDKEALNRHVRQVMDRVGLAQRLVNAYPHELDGGRRQRIGIGRALALEPKFIVCDEPVSALDVSIQAQILNLMQDIQEEMGLTYLFITHDLSVVKHLSNQIMVMYLGQVVEICDAKQLFRAPVHPYTKALLSAIPIPDPRVKMNKIPLKGELSSPINPKPGCRFAKRCPYATPECTAGDIPLCEVEPGHSVACIKAAQFKDAMA